jgi:hypothetical protein
MAAPLKTSDVFVPGRVPEYTYNPREDLRVEERLGDYLDEAGEILVVAGPTKTGKSVLLQAVVENPVWLDGQMIDSVDKFWSLVGDQLGVFTDVLQSHQSEYGYGTTARGQIGAPAVASAGVDVTGAIKNQAGGSNSVKRPVVAVVMEGLMGARRPVVIDDFHFMPDSVKKELVRALKPLALGGVPIIFVSITHRATEAMTAIPDMGGRVHAIAIPSWGTDELMEIARLGFGLLKVKDAGQRLAHRLAEASFGSPYLMQKFCRELCKTNGFRQEQFLGKALAEPESWRDFFTALTDGSARAWGEKLMRGPQERGGERTQWKLKGGTSLDGYGLTLTAIASTGPLLALRRDEVKQAIEAIIDGSGPQLNQTTRVLQHMSKIAHTRISDPVPLDSELDTESAAAAVDSDAARPDAQPVLDYVESGPNSTVYIADPFFAFYLTTELHARHDQQQLWKPLGNT